MSILHPEDKTVDSMYGSLNLESNYSRGILYLHDAIDGTTVLRMCRIPKEIMQQLPKNKSGVVLEPYENEKELDITGDGGELILGIRNVPDRIFTDLRQGFGDITYGFDPVELEVQN